MLHVLVSGFVQGIGYRQFVKTKAMELNLTGWVRNLPASRVEAAFVGDEKKLKKMIEFLKKGPFLAEVDSIEVEEIRDQKFDNFEIIK